MNFHSELTTFLGGSQTFLGVLTTIVVLCVFRSDGNFIYKILEYLTEKIDDQIKKMQDEASKEDEEIPNSKEYKLLQSYVEKSQLEIFRLPSINNGLKLLKEIRLKRTSWCISSIDWGQLYESRERIKSSEEQFVAPLYTFFYCLLIFVADEILRIAPNNLYIDMIVTFIIILTIYSTIMWSVLWLKLAILNMPDFMGLISKKTFLYKSIKMVANFFENINHSFKRNFGMYIFIILSLIGLYVFLAPFCPKGTYLTAIIVVVPMFFIALPQLCLKKNNNKNKYELIFQHFFALLLSSSTMTITVFYVTQYYSDSNMLFYYSNYIAIKSFIFLFVIINGLILPSYIPYLCYLKWYKKTKSIIAAEDISHKREKDQIFDKLREFLDKNN